MWSVSKKQTRSVCETYWNVKKWWRYTRKLIRLFVSSKILSAHWYRFTKTKITSIRQKIKFKETLEEDDGGQSIMFWLQLVAMIKMLVLIMLFLVLKKNLCALAVTLLAKYYQLSKLLSRGLEKSVYWNEHNGMNKNRNFSNQMCCN